MLKAGILGVGMIAGAHISAYHTLKENGAPVRLVAACDIDAEAFSEVKNFTKAPLDFNKYDSLETMLKSEELDIIDICLPTFKHTDATVDMLGRGYHVLCEKPMALNAKDCDIMLGALSAAKGQLMIGQCLRFFPQYQYLKELIDDKRYGKVVSAYFERLSRRPERRGENWLINSEKSGGCLLDVHIHDIDITRYLFGEPKSVSANAGHGVSRYSSVTTHLQYDDMLITASADWSLTPAFGFMPRFYVSFENATVVFENYTLTVHADTSFTPELDKTPGITKEIEYFVDIITNSKENTVLPPADSRRTVELMEVIKKSADSGGQRVSFC